MHLVSKQNQNIFRTILLKSYRKKLLSLDNVKLYYIKFIYSIVNDSISAAFCICSIQTLSPFVVIVNNLYKFRKTFFVRYCKLKISSFRNSKFEIWNFEHNWSNSDDSLCGFEMSTYRHQCISYVYDVHSKCDQIQWISFSFPLSDWRFACFAFVVCRCNSVFIWWKKVNDLCSKINQFFFSI